jgi:hypothetical protein
VRSCPPLPTRISGRSCPYRRRSFVAALMGVCLYSRSRGTRRCPLAARQSTRGTRASQHLLSLDPLSRQCCRRRPVGPHSIRDRARPWMHRGSLSTSTIMLSSDSNVLMRMPAPSMVCVLIWHRIMGGRGSWKGATTLRLAGGASWPLEGRDRLWLRGERREERVPWTRATCQHGQTEEMMETDGSGS